MPSPLLDANIFCQFFREVMTTEFILQKNGDNLIILLGGGTKRRQQSEITRRRNIGKAIRTEKSSHRTT